MARTHEHLVPYQFKKMKAQGSPGSHQEGKAAAGAPKKAMETPTNGPKTPVFGKHVAGNSVGQARPAAIQILLAGRTSTKAPVQQKHETRTVPNGPGVRSK